MKRIFLTLALISTAFLAFAQNEVDYGRPKSYIIGGIDVVGNTYFSSAQIVQQTGLQVGSRIMVPGDEVSNVIRRLYLQKYFDDVGIYIDHLSEASDSVFFRVEVRERPRVSRWSLSGVKSGEKKELLEKLNLRRGGEFTEYVDKVSSDVIKGYYAEKGFLLCDVKSEVVKDTVIKNAIRVNFAIDKGDKVKIKDINFSGNEHVKEYTLAKSMKKTKSAKFYNFFHSKKFDAKEFPNDKKLLLNAFNEQGYRDARIVRDTMYYVDIVKDNGKIKKKLNIDFEFEEGDRYYFRDVTWTGNSVYSTDVLDEILGISKGDVYDVVSMEKRLYGGGKQNEYDISKLYRDNGYLFFNITPVETNIQNDSVDVELRISEGKQATLNNIVINGNDLTSEKVVRRQVYTRPGYLFSQSDFERSIREIASLGQFDAEAIMGSDGYSIVPNQVTNTVDLVYNVVEKPSSQLELSGGWGG
ncbi:MAG: outer membrane protein assembly factor BamA, partial [Bacteroidales bacterium]|nr:outer membrane protein assembly factor BamA [Bacteroidales bacterium]